jgi:hypothetical protein
MLPLKCFRSTDISNVPRHYDPGGERWLVAELLSKPLCLLTVTCTDTGRDISAKVVMAVMEL